MKGDLSYNRQITRNMVFNTISMGLSYLISFFLTPYLVKMVGKEAYGFFPLINNMVGYTSIVTSAFGSMAGRFITISIFEIRIEDANKYFNSSYLVNIFLSIVFTIVGILLLPFLGKILTIPEYLVPEVSWLFILAIGILVISMLTGMFGLGVYVKNRIDLGAIRGMVNSIVRLACIIILFATLKPSIVYVSIATLIAGIVEMGMNLSFKKKFLPEVTLSFSRYFSWKHLKELFSSGIWNSFNCLSDILLRQLDLLITNIFIGSLVTGDYAIAKTVPTMLLTLMGTLSSTFFAQFNITYAKEGISSLLAEVRKSMKIIAYLTIIPVGFLLIFSNEFFALWIPGQNTRVIYLLSIATLVPMILNSAIYPIGGIFTTTNKLKVPSIVLFISGLFNIVLTYILLKTTTLGVYSIAIAAGIQTLLRDGIFTPIYAAHCLGQKSFFFFPTIFKNMCGVIIVLFAGFAFKYFVTVDNWYLFIIAFLVITAISMAVNYLVILDKSDRHFFKEKLGNYIKIKI